MKTQRIKSKKTQRVKPKRSLKDKEADNRRANFFHLKRVLPSHMSLPLDGLLSSIAGNIHLDIFRLEKQIPNYDWDKCTYKNKPNYSMSMAITEEWGKEAAKLIENLL